MFKEDNTGFINFPNTNNEIVAVDTGKTLVYLVCFEAHPKEGDTSRFDNINIFLPGIFVSDDVVARPAVNLDAVDLDSLIDDNNEQTNYDLMYFPNAESNDAWKRQMSINLISSVCIGWSNQTFEYRNNIKFWNATFKDLTHEGRNLYYSIKKLHNNKEVRILTFTTN